MTPPELAAYWQEARAVHSRSAADARDAGDHRLAVEHQRWAAAWHSALELLELAEVL